MQLQVLAGLENFKMAPASFNISNVADTEYDQSDFTIDYLVMSMSRVISYVVGRGCLL